VKASPGLADFCKLVSLRSGLVITAEKRYLVESRLAPIVERLALPHLDALLTRLQFGAEDTLLEECVEAVATHESSFFRDALPFHQLTSLILPRIMPHKAAEERIRIWSAACSMGQEAYSIAITLREHPKALAGRRFEILATDFASKAIAQGRAGIYSAFETSRGVSPERLRRWFTKREGGYELAPSVRGDVTFRRHNLLTPLNESQPFDVIFCRNLLIYLHREAKREVLEHLAEALQPEGILVIGSAESLHGVSEAFESIPETLTLFQRSMHSAEARR
jgi:chemotaxis protein methyltransferase CheR